MRRQQVRPVGSRVAIDFEDPHTAGIVLLGDRVERETAVLRADGRLAHLAYGSGECVDLPGVDLELGDAHIAVLAFLGHGDSADARKENDEQKELHVHGFT
jgi:hypothetical protein